MTDLLYLPGNEYQKEFEAEILKTRPKDRYIVLEKTLFYPEGGGQPADRGKIIWNGKEMDVTGVQKEHGEIRHYIDLEPAAEWPEAGDELKGMIDWERRFKHMRMHTAQHVVSQVVLEEYGASTAGNQIHEDRSRIDFKPVTLEDDDLDRIEKKVNSLIKEGHKVEKKMVDRNRAESMVEEGRTNLELIPDKVDPLRIVMYGDDVCPCGGTHVDNLEEIGKLKIVDRISKGAETERIEFVLK